MNPDSSRLEPAKAQGLPAKARGRCAERKLRRTGLWFGRFAGFKQIERIAVAILALARTILCGYRAAHQSITVDEASTYLNYVRGHWTNVWGPYDPNNHVLFSFLAQLSVRLFHTSDFTLRLPTVVAGFFFVLGFHRILELTVDSRTIRWITLLAVSTAPLLLDFSVAARGYGLAITLLIWALYFSIRGRDFLAGIFSGLAMAAGFNLAFSILGIALCPLVLGIGRWRARLRRVNSVVEPAAVVLLALCYPVIKQAHTDQFYIGRENFSDALYDFVGLTVRAIPGHGGWLGSGAAIRALEHFLLPAILILILATSARLFLRDPSSRRLLPALALLLLCAAIQASHLLLHFNYPGDRLTLPLFVFLALAWAIAVAQVPSRTLGNRAFRIANGVIGVVLILQFANQLHTRYFTIWQFDSSTKQVARYLRDNLRGHPRDSASVSAIWYSTPALEYYRTIYNISALKPIERNDPLRLDGYDYYMLNGDDRAKFAAQHPGSVRIFSDDLSGVIFTK